MADIKVGLELKGRLPDEYQEVEYIRSNGTQYINTLIKINPYTKVVCDFRFIEIPNSNSYLFGSLDESTNCFAVYRSSGGVFSYQFTDGWVNNKWTNIPIDTNRHLIELDALNKIIKIDNGNTLDEVISTSITTVSTMPLYIFSRSNSRGDLSEFSSIELYSFKVYQNNALKNNFVPCYNKNTKIAGLYDTYNNKFFENAGDGDDFIVGENANINEATLEDISLIQNARIPLEFQEVEYIESTGTQYIDTGIVGESGVYVQCKIEMMEIQEGCIIGARSGGVRYFPIHIYQEVFGFGNGSSWVASTYKPVINTIYEIQSSIKSTSQSFSINGSTVISKNENSQNNTNLNMFLFAMNIDGTNRLSSKFRLYNMIIANTLGQVVRNFVPCYRVSDRATGLYDLLSKEFFPNLGSGEFLLGENKGNIVEVSNTSILLTGDTFNKLSEKNNGLNMKSWASGYLSLSDGFVGGKDSFLSKQNGYDGYVFGEVSNNNEYPVTLQVNGEQIKWILIYGDKSANQFPTEIIVDGKTISNNSVMCIVGFEKMANSHQVEFVKWNRANYNACITYIGIFENGLVLDKRWIKSVESLSQSTGEPKEFYYGVTPSSGRIEIIDVNGEIKDYIQDGIFPISNVTLNIFTNGKQVQKHITSDSEYNNISQELSLDVTNELSLWDTELANNIFFSNVSQTAYDILKNSLKINDDILDTFISYENKTVKDYLKTITIPYPYVINKTKRQVADTICQLAQLQVMENDLGKIKFIPARPITANNIETNTILIPKNRQFSKLNYDIIVRNKINSVFVDESTIVANNEQFGEKQTINMEEELSEPVVKTYSSGAKGVVSQYASVYNTEKNAFNGNTEIVSEDETFTENGVKYNYKTYYYKTHIVFNMTQYKLNNDYTNDVKFYISYNKKGQNKNDQNVTIAPYKTVKEEVILNIANKTIAHSISEMNKDYIKIDNLRATQKELSFDLYTVQKRDDNIDNLAVYETYPVDITIGFVGNHYTIENNSIYNDEQIRISGNELIQSNATVNGESISQFIQNSIKDDYAQGIRNGTISISCSDYYYLNGNKAKNWSSGDIIEVGEMIKFEGDNLVWKVVGRNFRKTGVPMIDLELQEVRVVQ